MQQPLLSSDSLDFWIWVDPSNWLTRHQVTVVGSFTSLLPTDGSKETLMFLPNPNFQGFVGVFQNNILRQYIVEYNLELQRQASFPRFPSRLHCIFLFDSEGGSAEISRKAPLARRRSSPEEGQDLRLVLLLKSRFVMGGLSSHWGFYGSSDD
jgi:hypothetical protein